MLSGLVDPQVAAPHDAVAGPLSCLRFTSRVQWTALMNSDWVGGSSCALAKSMAASTSNPSCLQLVFVLYMALGKTPEIIPWHSGMIGWPPRFGVGRLSKLTSSNSLHLGIAESATPERQRQTGCFDLEGLNIIYI